MINKRILSIDVTRGLVMIIMAIDHIRDLIHVNSLNQDPLNFDTTNTTLFLTRLITHLCAPTFVFLSGVSAYLSYNKKTDKQAARVYLIKRGLWLILLEFTVINFGLWADIKFPIFIFQVIGAIGFGFAFLALLMKMKRSSFLIIGLAIVCLHDVVTLNINQPGFPMKSILAPLFVLTPLTIGKTIILVAYPIIPWIGIMFCGYGISGIFEYDVIRRKKCFLLYGFVILSAFVILRCFDVYGEISKWSIQKNSVFTVLSFLKVTKYPPSLLYTLLMTGTMFIILYLSEIFNNALTRFLTVFGKVPMFYYILHLYLIHTILFIILFVQGFKGKDLFPAAGRFGRPMQPNGLPLQYIYLVWIAVILILFPLCKWYGRYRQKHPEKQWLSYI